MADRRQLFNRGGTSYPRPSYTFNRDPTQPDNHETAKARIYSMGDEGTGYNNGYVSGVTDLGALSSSAMGGFGGGFGSGIALRNMEDTYLWFDSRAKTTDSNLSGGEMNFLITDQTASKQTIDNLVQIQIGAFWFPRIQNASAAAPDYFFFREVYMKIASLPASQAYLGPSGANYHFKFNVDSLSSVAVHLTPVNDTFFLQRPASNMSEFDVVFYVPAPSPVGILKTIPLPADVVAVNVENPFGGANLELRMVDHDTSSIGPIGVLPAPGVAVFFSGIVSTNPTMTAAINDPQGVFVSNVYDINFIEVAGITGIGGGATFTQTSGFMFIAKNRVAIPTRWTSVRDIPTNGAMLTHT